MKLITENEFAKLLGVSRERMQAIRRKGEIAYIPGRPPLFDQKDVDAFIAKRQAAKAPKPKLVPTEEDKQRAWEARKRRKRMWKTQDRQRRRRESDTPSSS